METPLATSTVRDGYLWVDQSCPICGERPRKFVGLRGGNAHREGLGVECEIWKCATCDLVFPNPMPVPAGGLGQHYDVDAEDYFKAHDKVKSLKEARALIVQAEELLGRKGKLLDIGAGRGEKLLAAIEAGWACQGVEPSATFADYTENLTGARIWRQAFEESDIPDSEFDVVLLPAVLEHLYDPDEVIENVSRILKPRGLLFVDVPNEAGLYFKVGNFYQKLRRRKWCVNLAPTFSPFHVFGFTPKSLRKLLDKYGLKPVVWRVYPGESMVPGRGGLLGAAESAGAKAVTAMSSLGEFGTYIETWAVKKA